MLTDLDYELLSAYIDDALTISERTAFELRLQAEPELSRELDELRATVTLLNNLPPRKAPRDFTLDVRYARRTSFFFTSATFSALSTAAAIILFALGTYLFTGSNISREAAPSSGQVAQSAFLPTSTSATLDKAAVSTAAVLNEVDLTSTTDANSSSASGLAASGSAAQESATIELPQVADQSPLFQADSAQPTSSPDDGLIAGSAVVAPTSPDSQGRTSEATETITNEQYAAPGSSNSTGGEVAPVPMQETDATDTEANTSMAFAATQAPFTATAALTSIPMPTATLARTATNTPQPTVTATLLPTVPPQPPAPLAPAASDLLPLILIGLGIALFIVAAGTTIMRRRNRS